MKRISKEEAAKAARRAERLVRPLVTLSRDMSVLNRGALSQALLVASCALSDANRKALAAEVAAEVAADRMAQQAARRGVRRRKKT